MPYSFRNAIWWGAMLLSQLIAAILDAGQLPGYSARARRHLRTANLLGLLFFVTTVPYVLLLASVGSWRLSLVLGIAALSYFAAPLLNAAGYRRLGRAAPLLIVDALVFSFAQCLGRDSGVHLCFFMAACGAFAVFDARRERMILVALQVLAGVGFLFVQFGGDLGFDFLGPLRWSQSTRFVFQVAAGVTAFAFFSLFVSLIVAREQKSEDQLLQQVDDLTVAESRLAQTSQELGRANAELEKRLDELARAQRQLLDASRRAGMADVATNVLHNVGNALNSVNVAAGFISDFVRSSEVKALQKATALLCSQADPAKFFTDDARGPVLLSYLKASSSALDRERERVVAEVAGLVSNVNHISAIITTQQSQARGGGFVERVALAGVIEDALRLDVLLRTKSRIKLERRYDEVTEIETDRHKVVQILVNLLSNARHALDTRASGRQVTIRTRALDDERVIIEVEDNGIGITQDQLGKIFAHGYTTKSEGHGFGLHASACAAIELGGGLSVDSAGPGRGACFRLAIARKLGRTSHPAPSTDAWAGLEEAAFHPEERAGVLATQHASGADATNQRDAL